MAAHEPAFPHRAASRFPSCRADASSRRRRLPWSYQAPKHTTAALACPHKVRALSNTQRLVGMCGVTYPKPSRNQTSRPANRRFLEVGGLAQPGDITSDDVVLAKGNATVIPCRIYCSTVEVSAPFSFALSLSPSGTEAAAVPSAAARSSSALRLSRNSPRTRRGSAGLWKETVSDQDY